MGKKIPLFISILTMMSVSLAGASNTFAISEDERHYWTLEEMLALQESVDAEIAEACGDDANCAERKQREFINRGGQYFALENFENSRFLISGVNPNTGTIKVFYKDINVMESHMTGTTVRSLLDEIYVVRLDESVPDPRYNMEWLKSDLHYPDYVRIGRNGASSGGTHLLIAENATRNGVGWLAPNVEHEYSVPVEEFTQNSRRLLFFTMIAGDDAIIGAADYAGCINSPDFGPDTECKLVFDDDFNSSLKPFSTKAATPADDPINGEGPTTENPDTPGDNGDPILPDDPIIPDNPIIPDDPIIPDNPIIDDPDMPGYDPTVPDDPITDDPNIPDGPTIPDDPIIDNPDVPSDDPTTPDDNGSPTSLEDNPTASGDNPSSASDDSSATQNSSNTSPATTSLTTTGRVQNNSTPVATAPATSAPTVAYVATPVTPTTPSATSDRQVATASTHQNNSRYAASTGNTAIAANNEVTADQSTSVDEMPTALKPLASTQRVDLPRSGQDQTTCDNTINFPWWLIIVMILCDVAIMWLFWPNKSRKSDQKSA